MIYFTEDFYHITNKKIVKKNVIHIGTYICLEIRKKREYISFSINCPGGGLRGSYEKNQLTPEGQEQL